MPNRRTILTTICVALALGLPIMGQAGDDDDDDKRRLLTVNCNRRQTITKALKEAQSGDTIRVRGTCRETVIITTDGLTLDGSGSAVIDGGERDKTVVTVDGAQRVVLRGFTVRHGRIGILGTGNASFALRETTVEEHAATGIRLEASSSLEMTNCTTQNNGFNGLDVDRASEVKIVGAFRSQGNGVFGIILGSNSSGTFATAKATVTRNILGIQVGINSSVFLADADTTVDTSGNITTGFTVVAGSTLFVFEGTIISNNNVANHGVSANSNSNIDLDRGGSITAKDNGLDGIQLEDSLLNLFNMPGLAASKVTVLSNGRNGLSALVESRIDLSTDSEITSSDNAQAGVLADNGSTIRIINSTIQLNGVTDIDLSFGARADLRNNKEIGSIRCDQTVLIRGDTGTTCPTP